MNTATSSKVRVHGYRWCPRTFVVTSLLSTHLVPFDFVPIESPEQAAELLGSPEVDYNRLPVVIFDEVWYFGPSEKELAERIGLTYNPSRSDYYDLVIIGAGPAGLSAAVYGASEGLSVTILERFIVGGQAGLSARIENYLGFADGVSGSVLAQHALRQASRFGAEVLTPREVHGIRVKDGYKLVRLDEDTELACRALLLSTGVNYRTLDAEGVADFVGAGVYYSAPMSEALLYDNEHALVVGGANSAGQAAVALSRRSKQVTLLVRGRSLAERMSRYLIDTIERIDNIKVMFETEVAGARGEMHLEEVLIRNRATGEEQWIPADVLYAYIGAEPHTDCMRGLLELDRHGFIITGSDGCGLLETTQRGIFAAGDVRSGSTKRVATAVGEGAMAIAQVHAYLGA